ncbi:hypothetical protein FGO68_gene8302 [Halteria grandinella]|uniref:Uncharacterized protein n=1 Tax=Halteria grandinella TaxID=5974 RepID=A0A8J8NAW8_HALGN|nr:hypothetical protein FGO68_gene8302 [Halteria grandinella]
MKFKQNRSSVCLQLIELPQIYNLIIFSQLPALWLWLLRIMTQIIDIQNQLESKFLYDCLLSHLLIPLGSKFKFFSLQLTRFVLIKENSNLFQISDPRRALTL